MAFLPETSSEFSSPGYWKKFFAARSAPFEWYGDLNDLGVVIDRYLKHGDNIIQLGCGNSQLASQLYDAGYRTITSIDTNERVITDQQTRNRNRPELVFRVGDATHTLASDGEYSAAIDKGTLDALLPPNASQKEEDTARAMFEEVSRILKPAGRYIVVSLAQHHIVRFWYHYFNNSKLFLLRIHRIENTASGFPMPVFIFVATKMREPLKMNMPLDVMRSESDRPERVSDVDGVVEVIHSEQQLGQFVHLCASRLEHEISIVITNKDGAGRYKMFVLDGDRLPLSYAVFVVPIGRDSEWLFATEKGRRSLRAQCDKDRLAIVILFRDEQYESLQVIKDELTSFVLRLNPSSNTTGVEFLSMGEHDVKKTIAKGHSAINGDWTVEEVTIRDRPLRRLVFLSSQNLVQSEAYLKVGKKKKKVVSMDELACDHHDVMLIAFALLPDSPLLRPKKVHVNVSILGLGGGLLAGFINKNLPESYVTGVDIDPDILEIANKYFNFPYSDPRLRVKIMDAVDYLAETAKSDEKMDVLLVDLASSMSEEGLSCPPPIFLTDPVLQDMHDSLAPNGVLALNLVTRDNEVAEAAKARVARHFPSLFNITNEEEVNEVLIAPRGMANDFDVKKFTKNMNKEQPWQTAIAEKLEKLRILSENHGSKH